MRICLTVLLLCAVTYASAQKTPPEALKNVEGYTQVMDAGMQPLSNPEFVNANEANLPNEAVVFGVTDGTEAKAYTVNFLSRISVVNEYMGGQPIAVAFCPFANDGAVFSRTVDGQERFLASSGGLFKLSLVMADPASGSYWSFLDGKGLGGALKDNALQSSTTYRKTSWAEWLADNPNTKVWAVRGQTYAAENPYAGYLASPKPLRPVEGMNKAMPPKTPLFGFVLNEKPFHMSDRAAFGGWVGKAGKEKIFLYRAPTDRLGQSTRAFLLKHDGEDVKLKAKNDEWVSKKFGYFNPLTGAFDSGVELERINGMHTFWYIWSEYYPKSRSLGRRIGFSEFQRPRERSERQLTDIQ